MQWLLETETERGKWEVYFFEGWRWAGVWFVLEWPLRFGAEGRVAIAWVGGILPCQLKSPVGVAAEGDAGGTALVH
jgi:hypothetical protein